jgi:hypothetical protein
MKKTPASLRSDAPAAISETGGRNGTKSLAELSEIPKQHQNLNSLTSDQEIQLEKMIEFTEEGSRNQALLGLRVLEIGDL